MEDVAAIQAEAAHKAELAKAEPITLKELEAVVEKWMLMSDPGIVRLLCAIYVSNKLPRDPVWVMVIGPSGGGKTELLTSLLDCPDIYPVSILTPNTFLSGMGGQNDASLLPKVNGKILIFKDWTSILSMNKDARAEIMGQLREIYDGHFKKPFGNGKVGEWKGKIGLIAGTTPAVDLAQQMHTTLGERFIHYRVSMPDRIEVALRSIDNGDYQVEMRTAMKAAFHAFLKTIPAKPEAPKIPDEIKMEIAKVANFATMARSGVIREFSFKKEVIFVPAVEMPTRITLQLCTLAQSLAIIENNEFTPESRIIIYKIALDSIPQTNKMVMVELAKENMMTTAEIATELGYPTSPVHMYLENLAMLGVCKRHKGKATEEGGNADRWELREDFAELLRKHEGIVKRDRNADNLEVVKEVFGDGINIEQMKF